MIDRIIKIRKQSGLSQEKFAQKIGLSRNFINQVESGKKNVSDRTISDICREFNINDKWLRNGIGPMKTESFSEYIDNIPSDDKDFIKELIEVYKDLDSDSKEALKLLARKMIDKNKNASKADKIIPRVDFTQEEMCKTRVIYYFQRVSAGDGELIVDGLVPEKYEIPDIPEYKNVDYAVMVDGISMQPMYEDGDMLLIQSMSAIDINQIGIFDVDGKAYVKKLGETELISLNPNCRNVSITEDTRCQGLVIGKISK